MSMSFNHETQRRVIRVEVIELYRARFALPCQRPNNLDSPAISTWITTPANGWCLSNRGTSSTKRIGISVALLLFHIFNPSFTQSQFVNSHTPFIKQITKHPYTVKSSRMRFTILVAFLGAMVAAVSAQTAWAP